MRILLLLIFALCLCCCDENAGVWLPEKTAEGMNTMGFITDDRVWMNYGVRCTEHGCRENMVSAVLHKSGEQPFEFVLKGGFTVQRRGIDQTFELVAHHITGPGTYTLDSTRNDRLYYALYDSAGCRTFVNSSTGTELIITTYDTTRHIIAGEFRAQLACPAEPGKHVHIREGRFDAELVYQHYK
jgi:hypothetical protein